MDENISSNAAVLCGTVTDRPVFSHCSRSESFFTFPISVMRLSGAYDRINVIMREELCLSLGLSGGERLRIVGELRSFNNKSGEGAKLVISVYAKDAERSDGGDENSIRLIGTLCKKPNLRTTPMGRDICDLMLAVNRRYGRSDYLPCITWGAKAREASLWDVGTVIELQGRIQSRSYIKLIGNEPVEKTAFEVSVIDAYLR